MQFSGKTIIITGGSSGIGADMARAFADQGGDVWIAGRRADKLAAVAAHAPDRIRVQVCDVAVEADVMALFDAAGAPDIVIANAGFADNNPLVRVETPEWDRIIATNLTGAFWTLREAARRMTGGWGRIIGVSSIAGLRGLAYAGPYAASKHGLIGLVRSLALEVAGKGITVNAICPGYVETELTDAAIERITERSGRSAAEASAAMTSLNPMGRMIRPEEITSAALWLASEGASSVNGETIAISGGQA